MADVRTAPLSFAQERLWFIDATTGESVTYNVPLFLRWQESVDSDALASALETVVRRHEILRTRYEIQDGARAQIVQDPVRPQPEVIDLAGVSGAEELLQAQAHERARRPFDLSADAPLRCTVWTGSPEGDAVLLVVHHIAIDGWSLAPLFEDLATAYTAARADTPADGTDLPGEPEEQGITYTDYAVWEREAFQDPALQRHLADRVGKLLALPPGLKLGGISGATPRAAGARPGALHRFEIPDELTRECSALAGQLRATPFVLFLAAFVETLARWSGRDEFLLGTVAANRVHPAAQRLVGFLVNTVPLICRRDPDATFAQLCADLRPEAYGALTLQRIPFDQLTAKAAAAGGHSDLVDVTFALQNWPAPRTDGPPRWSQPEILPTGTAKFDALLVLDQTPTGLAGSVEFDTDLYPEDFGRLLAADYLAVLTGAIAEPLAPVAKLPLAYGPPAPPPLPAAAWQQQEATGLSPDEFDVADETASSRPEPELTAGEQAAADLFESALADLAPGARLRRPSANFFSLGGHSLLAVTMLAEAGRAHGVTVRPRDFLADPTVAGLGALLDEARTPAPDTPSLPGLPDTEGRTYPASSVQQRLWFLDRIPQLRLAYLVPAVLELTGQVDTAALATALDTVLARHPALHSRFTLDRKLRQVVYTTDGPPARSSIVQATSWDGEQIADHIADLCWNPFDLAGQAPARAEILVREGGALLVLCAHHIVMDGWSLQILLEQVGECYRAAMTGAEPHLAAPVHPAQAGAGPDSAPGQDRIAQAVAALADAPTDVLLPHDRPRPDVQSIAGAIRQTRVDADTAAELRTLGASHGCSTFLVTASLLAATLSRRSGQRDFVFVFPWLGREGPAAAEAVGMFVNTAALRVDLRGRPTWRELLSRLRSAGAEAYRNADVPFDAVVAAVHPERDLSRPALTPVYLDAAENARVRLDLGPGTEARPRSLDPLAVKYEFELTALEEDAELVLSASYQTALFDEQTVDALLADLVKTARRALEDPDAPVNEEN